MPIVFSVKLTMKLTPQGRRFSDKGTCARLCRCQVDRLLTDDVYESGFEPIKDAEMVSGWVD